MCLYQPGKPKPQHRTDRTALPCRLTLGLSAARAVHRSSLFQPRRHNWELRWLALVSKWLCLYFPPSPVSFSPYLSSALCYLFLPHLSLQSADELGCCSGRKLIFTLTEVARQVMLSSGCGILLGLSMIRNRWY